MRKELLYFSDLPPLFILVIMEDTLRALQKNSPTMISCALILVLMEYTLRA